VSMLWGFIDIIECLLDKIIGLQEFLQSNLRLKINQ
jgi:hypothetical protein